MVYRVPILFLCRLPSSLVSIVSHAVGPSISWLEKCPVPANLSHSLGKKASQLRTNTVLVDSYQLFQYGRGLLSGCSSPSQLLADRYFPRLCSRRSTLR